MLAEIHHANGVVYGQGLDDHWMRRPGSLSVDHPLHSLSLVEGERLRRQRDRAHVAKK